MYPPNLSKVAGQGLEPWSQGPKPWLGEESPKTPLSNDEESKGFALNSLTSREGKNGLTEKELIEFYEYCLKMASEETCRQYINYLKKPPSNAKNSILAWKKFYKWKGDLEASVSYTHLTVLELPIIIPMVFKLLLESGIRLREAVKVLNEYDEKNNVKEDGFYVYTLNWTRGPKKVFYVFHISSIAKTDITYNYAKNLLHEKGIAPKYVRKFVTTKLAELGVSAEVIDFMQGRTPSSILGKHYLNLLALAKKDYRRYAE
ncbi:integrase [Sulfolobus acidocaldarius]|uniref:integrase n=1 Tax=Sulfolobus acidocaldarius TaxID=2285 RepID=UPI000781C2E0|nr:integrase [Sulfolobus acidocaldarius]